MKKWIVLLHDGKELKSSKDALPDAETLYVEILSERIESALSPFKSEIEKEGGQVRVDFKGNAQGQPQHNIQYIDLSKGLEEKAHQSVLKGLSD